MKILTHNSFFAGHGWRHMVILLGLAYLILSACTRAQNSFGYLSFVVMPYDSSFGDILALAANQLFQVIVIVIAALVLGAFFEVVMNWLLDSEISDSDVVWGAIGAFIANILHILFPENVAIDKFCWGAIILCIGHFLYTEFLKRKKSSRLKGTQVIPASGFGNLTRREWLKNLWMAIGGAILAYFVQLTKQPDWDFAAAIMNWKPILSVAGGAAITYFSITFLSDSKGKPLGKEE